MPRLILPEGCYHWGPFSKYPNAASPHDLGFSQHNNWVLKKSMFRWGLKKESCPRTQAEVTWISDIASEVKCGFHSLYSTGCRRKKPTQIQGEGTCLHLFLGSMTRSCGTRRCGRVITLQPLGEYSLHTWMLLPFASISQDSHMYKEYIQTPHMKPRLCK